MKIAALIILALASAASAQTPPRVILLEADGKLTTSCSPAPRDPPLPLPPPINSAGLGLPKQLGGTCTEAIITADGTGGAAAYWCAQPEPEKARLALFAVNWDFVTLPMILDFGQLLMMGDKAQRIADMHRKYQSMDVRDMCNIWSPLVARLNAIYPAPLPALKQWVAVGGAIFSSNGTTLTGLTGRRVLVGVNCRADVAPIIAGIKVYYPQASAPQGSLERIECRQATP